MRRYFSALFQWFDRTSTLSPLRSKEDLSAELQRMRIHMQKKESDAQQQIQQLQQDNERLQYELAWRNSAYGRLEHYSKNLHFIASEHPGKLAIAVFSCLEHLPFNPFDYALDVENKYLSQPSRQRLSLKPGDNWFARFIGYYCSLDSHLLDIYKKKKDEHGVPLAESDRPTLTGVQSDPKSPVFNQVMETKQMYRTFLPKETYGADMIVKVFPLFDETHNLIGMVSFTHDITLHLEQQNKISEGLGRLQNSATSLLGQVNTVQEVSASINGFSQGIDQLEEEIQKLISNVHTLEQNSFSSIRAIQMLSINAGVEAVRAGEAGKGFQVIANEVKRLTEEMAQSIQYLESVVTQIHTIKDGSVDKLQSINELAQKIHAIAQKLQGESVSYQSILSTISSAEESYKNFIHNMIA